MAIIEVAKIQVRRGQELQTGVPQLDPGEFGWAQDTENLYIGKRIQEGAVDNLNTRILTEKDINNIFSILNVTSTATVITPYKYRSEDSYISNYTLTRFIQDKLDEVVSLEEFGVSSSFTATDITSEFQTGVNTIFFNSSWNSIERQDARRKLKIPAGHFYISSNIELPPYTYLEGEGEELTKLTLITTTTSMFRSVDADGDHFETESMESGVKRSRQISLKNITIEYDPYFASNNPLLSIDNALNFSVENCTFRTAFTITNTSTFGLVSQGIGIGIRGIGGGIGSGDVNLCENIEIKNCHFDSLYVGIKCRGPVIRPTVQDSIFSNLDRGVELGLLIDGMHDNLPGPSNGIIQNNRFENIVKEAIYVDENPLSYRTNHLSENNFFIQTGNGIGLSDVVTTNTNVTSVIKFNSQGNKSLNDYFHRRTLANNSTATFYYAPLITGNALIESVEVTTATVFSTSTTSITKIPLTSSNQFVTIKYQLFNNTLARKGKLDLNINPEGNTVITDNYSYIETVDEGNEPTNIYFDIDNNLAIDKNFLSLTCVNTSTDLTMEYTIDILV